MTYLTGKRARLAARHFLPRGLIENTLEELAAVKMNVVHWHLTDAVSFPLELPSAPLLALKGSFSADQVYSVSDTKRIVSLASNLSIRVVPEIDLPAHSASWGMGYPDVLANCSWLVPRDLSQADNPYKHSQPQHRAYLYTPADAYAVFVSAEAPSALMRRNPGLGTNAST